MDKLVVLLYDLSAVLIILMTVAYSAQKGFATGIFRLLGRLAALFGSAFLAKNGAELIYDQFLKTEVTAFLSQNLQGGQLTDIIAQLQAGLQQLPKVYSNVIGMAIDTDSISQALNSGAAQLTAALEQSVIGPAVRGALSVVIFSLCYLLLSGLVRLLTSAIHFVFHSPILLPIDRFFGAVMGFLQSCLNLYFICILFKLVFYLLGGMKYCNQQIILDTMILSRFYTFDPLALLASL